LAQVMESTDPLPNRPIALNEFSKRFLAWLEPARLENKTKTYYRNGWRLLEPTAVVNTRVAEITGDCAERLKFPGSSANANCALRTLRRMLHKAEEWKLIDKVPKFKLLREGGRTLRLDDEAEQKLLVAAEACGWTQHKFELFRDVLILARDTGMRKI